MKQISNIELPEYRCPTHQLLNIYQEKEQRKEGVGRQKLYRIVKALLVHGIRVNYAQVVKGPSTITYKIWPHDSTKISKIKKANVTIGLEMKTDRVRIVAPTGEDSVHIQIPRQNRRIVTTREIIQSDEWKSLEYALPIAIGTTPENQIKTIDLREAPHMLVGGASGQGKSVAINNYITGLITKCHPSEMKFVLADPKKVELSIFECLDKHYLAAIPGNRAPIITDKEELQLTLNALVNEMEERFELMKKAAVRDIDQYNQKFLNEEIKVKKHRYLPYIVLVIDGFADFMMEGAEQVEQAITKIARKARATGIHMIIVTQRPSVDVVTGNIKANISKRVAFKATSGTDSRVILDEDGAEKLLGQGDALLKQSTKKVRCQSPFISTEEVQKVVHHISEQKGYNTPYFLDKS